ncbi:MAG: carbohydrate binding domain-containing protein, partial [Oscillospiraceae bacterium]|nr:carbohydrate binding domain-containing protein [Oscillospiraceae bacterium]
GLDFAHLARCYYHGSLRSAPEYCAIYILDNTLKKPFDGYYLTKILDNNGNKQIIHWDMMHNRIEYVKDAAGRMVTFDYDSGNYLTSITDPAGRATTFACNGDNLSAITYPDGKTTLFNMDPSIDLDQILTCDGKALNVIYTDLPYNSGSRVSYVDSYYHDNVWVQTNQKKFDYTLTNEAGQSTGQTRVDEEYYYDYSQGTYSTSPGDRHTYFFDYFGRATSVANQYGQTQFREYHNLTATQEDRNRFNKIKDNSELQTVVTNLLKNHGFEYGTDWGYSGGGSFGYTTDFSSRGNQSMRMSDTDPYSWNHVMQEISLEPGETYTISADFYIPEELEGDGGVVFGYAYYKSGWSHPISQPIKSTNGWERHSYTFTCPDDSANSVSNLITITQYYAAGEFYFDNIQLEKSGGARYYNLVENSDFSNAPGVTSTPTGTVPFPWNLEGTSDDGVLTEYGRNWVRLTGEPNSYKLAAQTVFLNAQEGETMIIGGSGAAFPVEGGDEDFSWGVFAWLYESDSSIEYYDWVYVPFDKTVPHHHQTVATSYTFDRPCHRIRYAFLYYNQANIATFDDAFVYLGNYGDCIQRQRRFRQHGEYHCAVPHSYGLAREYIYTRRSSI